ncbi:MAG: tetratricopeptide repeat protein, partial [Flavobacteriales bacterium]
MRAKGIGMDNDMGYPNDEGNEILVRRYETMLDNGRTLFFDLHEFEELIDYFIGEFELEKARHALKVALLQHPNAPSLIMLNATLLSLSGQYDEAIKLLGKIEGIEWHNPDY